MQVSQDLFRDAVPGIGLGEAVVSTERRLSHLKMLEAESIYILREAVAEFARSGDAVLDRQRFVGDAAAGAEGVLSRQDSVSAAAHRHQLQISGNDRVSRLATRRKSARS